MTTPLSLDELNALRANLVRARLRGVKQCRDQNGEELTFKSDAEMQNAIASVEAEIARLSQTQVKQVRFITTKG